VAELADYTKWQNRTAGGDYERVLVAADISDTAGIDLTYSQTKQVVFDDGVTLTVGMNEAEGRVLYRTAPVEDDDEYWLYKPAIVATNSTGVCYGFKDIKEDIESPVIAETAYSANTPVYLFSGCGNIYAPVINNISWNNNNAIHVFKGCVRVVEPEIKSIVTGQNYSGAIHCFEDCGFVDHPVITKAASTSGSAGSSGSSGSVYCFENCGTVDNPTIDSASTGNGGSGYDSNYSAGGPGGSSGSVYCFENCGTVINPTINSASTGTGASGGSGTGGRGGTGSTGTCYGFKNCREVITPKAALAGSAGPSYMHYLWAGLITNRAGSNAKTALFYPDYGPLSLILSEAPRPGKETTLSWQFINPAGEAVSKTAVLQESTDGGASWKDIYKGAGTAFDYTVPASIKQIQFRVLTGTGASPTSGTAYYSEVEFALLPVISGEDEDLGEFSAWFAPYRFTVQKNAEDAGAWAEAAVKVYIDGRQVQAYSVNPGVEKTLFIAGDVWRKLANGGHTVKIEARRIIDGSARDPAAVRRLTFTRKQTRAVITLMNPAAAAAKPEQIELAIGGAFPEGSSLTVEACNNGHDLAPAWEDMTADYEAGEPHQFTNGAKTDGEWGVNIRLTLERGAAEGECYIDSVAGDYQ
jgi:hypothetical protein